MNLAIPLLRDVRSESTARRRTIAVDTAIVLSTAAALAHLVTAPDHYTWWPAAGVFFAVLGVLQLAYSWYLFAGFLTIGSCRPASGARSGSSCCTSPAVLSDFRPHRQ